MCRQCNYLDSSELEEADVQSCSGPGGSSRCKEPCWVQQLCVNLGAALGPAAEDAMRCFGLRAAPRHCHSCGWAQRRVVGPGAMPGSATGRVPPASLAGPPLVISIFPSNKDRMRSGIWLD